MSDKITPKLDPEVLYFGHNGRITCGRAKCAGATMAYSGRTLEGLRAVVLDRDCAAEIVEVEGFNPKCEGCGFSY